MKATVARKEYSDIGEIQRCGRNTTQVGAKAGGASAAARASAVVRATAVKATAVRAEAAR